VADTDIMGTFQASADKHKVDIVEYGEAFVARSVREVVGRLRDSGLDISLDVRPGGHGCPDGIKRDGVKISGNGTILFESLPVIYTLEYEDRDFSLRMYLGASRVAQISLKHENAKEKDRWSADCASSDILTEIAAALGRVKAGNSYLNQFDLAPSTARIEVSAPLKLKVPGQSA